jgi:hypothetical protein
VGGGERSGHRWHLSSHMPCNNLCGPWRPALTAAILIGIAVPAFAQQRPVAPAPQSPASLSATFPAHDQHENVTVAVTLCADETCSRQVFGKHHPVQGGILPVDVYIRNDSDQTLVAGLAEIRLDVSPAVSAPENSSDSTDDASDSETDRHARPQELAPLSTFDTAQRILYPTGSSQPRAPGTPQIGWFHSDKNVAELAAKFDPLALNAGVINPHSTVHGYLFFDLNGNFALLSRSSLYLPSIHTQDGAHYLTYFEVNLAAARAR